MTTKSTSVKAGPRPSTAELLARVADLTDINEDLFAIIESQRDVYRDLIEETLLTAAVDGYKPAVAKLKRIRQMFRDAKAAGRAKALELRRARADA